MNTAIGSLAVGAVTLMLCSAGCRAREADVNAEGAPTILISVDTLRSDRISAYGSTSVRTPRIDALASDSIQFERVYSQSPLTLPSHATIFTGLLPPTHGVRNNKGYFLDAEFETLAERLGRPGYRTLGVVSSEVLSSRTGIEQGFDEFIEPSRRSGKTAFAETRGDVAVKQARDWLGSLQEERFFLFLHLYDPHIPYEAPEPYASRHNHPYDAEVAYTDHLIGEFLDFLAERGIYDRALIVFLSDHGEGLGDHVEEQHGIFLYRESLQVPLLVKLPAQQRAGDIIARPAALIDVAPTILDLLELEREGLPGRSLFDHTQREAERVIYSESLFGLEQYGWAELKSAIEGPMHYIQAPRPELYDLSDDPEEAHNLLPDRSVPGELIEAIANAGEGRRSQRTISREEEERLAALGYLGGPGEDTEPPDAERPDPKDFIHEAVELESLIREIGLTDSIGPELRVIELLDRLGVGREPLRRVIATNLLSVGRPRPALEVLQPFSDSADAGTLLTLGEIAVALGQLGEARSRFERVLREDPNNPEAHRDMGILLLTEGRFGEARPWLERAVEFDAGLAEAWNGLGVANAQRGDMSGAIRAWRRAVELDPELGDAWFNLALALKNTGDRKGAAMALERYLPLAQGSDQARARALLKELGHESH